MQDNVQSLFKQLILLFLKLFRTKAKTSPNFARELYENREFHKYFGIVVKDPLPGREMDDQEILLLDGLFKIIPNSATLWMEQENEYEKLLDKNSHPSEIEHILKKFFFTYLTKYIKNEHNIEIQTINEIDFKI